MNDPKYQHGSSADGWMEHNDTPRTDAVFSEPCAIHQVMQKWEKIILNSRQLERELAEAKQWLNERYKALSEADERAEKAEAEVERLRSTMRSFIDFMDDNLGTTADWPMEASFDDEETCQRHCDHLNAMKRIVKPEGIN